MAMKEVLPFPAPDGPPSRCCIRFSPCLLVSGVFLFFLLFQFHLQITAPQANSLRRQVFLYLQRLRPNPSFTQLSPPAPWTTSRSTPSPVPPPPPPPRVFPVSSSLPASTSPLPSLSTPPPATEKPESSPPWPPLQSSSSLFRQPRVAICLVGGARSFELTGPTIKKYLLQSVPNSDVFLHAPLDKDSYKLSLLKDIPNHMHIRIFSPKPIPEDKATTKVLTASGSPNGIQGLLQYFNLVEGCLDMISQIQMEQNFTYEWIIRTRLDGYWSDHFPSFSNGNHSAYIVPLGSQFGGLNDRLGVGNWETTKVALARLSLIRLLHTHGAWGLNSEKFFKQQLKLNQISSKQSLFPFCILSHRRYGWPPGRRGIPVLSLSSKGNLNGAKCRPCTPASTGVSAKWMLHAEDKSWGWPGYVEQPELCNPVGAWEPNWENIFDEVAGPENARIRKQTIDQNLSDCVQAFEEWREKVVVWEAPISHEICKKGLGRNLSKESGRKLSVI